MTEIAGTGPEISTPAGDAPVIPLVLLGMGMYLAWFGVHYWRSDVRWPSDPVKAALTGKPLPAPARSDVSPHAQLAADVQALQPDAGTSGSGGSGSGGSGSGGSSGGGTLDTQGKTNRQILQMYAAAHGWAGAQWDCLDWVEMAEAGYNSRAQNSSSGAFGLAQALGHGTAGTAGRYGNNYGANYGLTTIEAIAANNGDAGPQAKWMCNYVKARYGTPCAAKAYHQAHNSY